MLEARQSYLGDKRKCEAFTDLTLCAFQRPLAEKLAPKNCESVFQIGLNWFGSNIFAPSLLKIHRRIAKLLKFQSSVCGSVGAAESERSVTPLYRETDNVGGAMFLLVLLGSQPV